MKNALIIGASGGIGSALYDYYLTQKNYELVKSLSRSNDGFDTVSYTHLTLPTIYSV